MPSPLPPSPSSFFSPLLQIPNVTSLLVANPTGTEVFSSALWTSDRASTVVPFAVETMTLATASSTESPSSDLPPPPSSLLPLRLVSSDSTSLLLVGPFRSSLQITYSTRFDLVIAVETEHPGLPNVVRVDVERELGRMGMI